MQSFVRMPGLLAIVVRDNTRGRLIYVGVLRMQGVVVRGHYRREVAGTMAAGRIVSSECRLLPPRPGSRL